MGGILGPPVCVRVGNALGGARGSLEPVSEGIGKAPPLGETNTLAVFGTFQIFEDVFDPFKVPRGGIMGKLRQETDTDTQIRPGAGGEPIEPTGCSLIRFHNIHLPLGWQPIVRNAVNHQTGTVWQLDRIAINEIQVLQHGFNLGGLSNCDTETNIG
jgi:hypothetical protein